MGSRPVMSVCGKVDHIPAPRRGKEMRVQAQQTKERGQHGAEVRYISARRLAKYIPAQ